MEPHTITDVIHLAAECSNQRTAFVIRNRYDFFDGLCGHVREIAHQRHDFMMPVAGVRTS